MRLKNFVEKDGVVYFKEGEYANFFWSPYSLENDNFLYETFGVLLQTKYNPDSPEYKLRLEGLMYAFTHGSTIKSLETALNILSGAPMNISKSTVVEGFSQERGLSVFTSPTEKTIIDLKGYKLSPLIREGDHLDPYQPISKSIEIRDEMNKPRWWDIDYIDILSPLVNYRLNEEGHRRVLTQEQRRLVNEILKHNCFGIRIPAEFVSEGGTITIDEIKKFVNEIKPAWTFGLTYVVFDAGMFDSENPFSSENFIDVREQVDITVEMEKKDSITLEAGIKFSVNASLIVHTHKHIDLGNILGAGVDGNGFHLNATELAYFTGN